MPKTSSQPFGFITNDVLTLAYSQHALAYLYAAAGLLIYLHINVDTKEKNSKKESNSNNSFLLIKKLNAKLKAPVYHKSLLNFYRSEKEMVA